MTKSKLMNTVFQWGVMAAIVAVAFPDLAQATPTTGIAGVLDSVRGSEATSIPLIISTVCYIGGAAMAASGALKLKAHAENPAQEKIAPGIARVLTGGALVAMPYLVGVAQRTTHLGTTQADYITLNHTF